MVPIFPRRRHTFWALLPKLPPRSARGWSLLLPSIVNPLPRREMILVQVQGAAMPDVP